MTDLFVSLLGKMTLYYGQTDRFSNFDFIVELAITYIGQKS